MGVWITRLSGVGRVWKSALHIEVSVSICMVTRNQIQILCKNNKWFQLLCYLPSLFLYTLVFLKSPSAITKWLAWLQHLFLRNETSQPTKLINKQTNKQKTRTIPITLAFLRNNYDCTSIPLLWTSLKDRREARGRSGAMSLQLWVSLSLLFCGFFCFLVFSDIWQIPILLRTTVTH